MSEIRQVQELHRVQAQQGFTLIELIIVMAILGILFTLGILSVRGLQNDAGSAATILKASLIETRTQALSTTSARRVSLIGGALVYERNTSCPATTGWTALTSPELPEGVTLSAPTAIGNWKVCFTSRGTLQAAPTGDLKMTDRRNKSRTITVYLTGSVISQ